MNESISMTRSEKQVFTAQAYGRVNLIGEHTDYNGGWVLPTAIPQMTRVELRPRADDRVEALTEMAGAENNGPNSYRLGDETPVNGWLDYLQGATLLLRQSGHKIGGFSVRIDSTVPVGSGLSSSAALEISFVKALRDAFDLKLSDVDIALLGQRIENEFVGARVGIMDQMACALAREGEALFLDTLDLTFERVALPLNEVDLMVINSGIAHRHSGGDYNQRRAECEDACRRLGVAMLRDLEVRDLPRLEILPDVLKRRARHVITENARVHSARQALAASDVSALGMLFVESHRSMRDDYNVSIPEIDLLVDLCLKHDSVFGARLTGGGFGGSIVALSRKGSGRRVSEAVVAEFNRRTGEKPTILV